MADHQYCDNQYCPRHKLADAPGPVEVIDENRIIKITRHNIQSVAGNSVYLCGVCYWAVSMVCIEKTADK